MVLLAPAFSFLTRWPEELSESKMEEWKRTGVLRVFHYSQGREAALGYQLIEDAMQYEHYPKLSQPTIIFHGKHDTVVPPGHSHFLPAASADHAAIDGFRSPIGRAYHHMNPTIQTAADAA